MKRSVLNTGVAAGSVILLLVAWFSAKVEQQATRDEAQPADVILVLGAAEYRGRPSPVLKARLDHALELYQRHMAPRILTTGGAGGDPVFTEGGVGRDYLAQQGVPAEDIVVEGEGSSTVASVALASEIMRRMGIKSAIVVSDGYHIYRVKKMLERDGITVYGSPRSEHARPGLHERWNYLKQAVGYMLWSCGVPV
ncbi:MAG TPA: YdcF family protein [Bryobacteraceae bacterium]|nr:YdcF family protein [Bryobacteraceae bacterium]